MRLARHLVVSALLLTSSSTLAEEVLAEDEPAEITALVKDEGNEIINFECAIPVIGSVRCTSTNRNVRLGARHKLHVVITSVPKDKCVNFTVHHAVDNKEVSPPIKVCGHAPAKELWSNGKDEAVDVYTMAMAANWDERDKFTIKGYYIITSP